MPLSDVWLGSLLSAPRLDSQKIIGDSWGPWRFLILAPFGGRLPKYHFELALKWFMGGFLASLRGIYDYFKYGIGYGRFYWISGFFKNPNYIHFHKQSHR